MKEFVMALCLTSGLFLMITAAIGLLRLPDLYCRSHAVAKASSLGIFLLLIALWLDLATEVSGLKLALAIIFQVLTIPVSSHLVGLLAREKNLPRWRGPNAGRR
jgi:multicomponent Na+:H+ antiporter subunit G